MWKGRVVLHVDMNAYFASVEQKGNPLIRGKPVVVVGDLSRRSVILTASYEARAYGIRTGMLLHEARRMCPRVIPIQGQFDKYMSTSDEILRVLSGFSDRVEMSSCDEAYLDMTVGNGESFRPEEWGMRVHDRIRNDPGLPCSVGVAPNKLLAKLASDMKKPDGVVVISPGEAEGMLREMPVERLCGVGDRLKEALNGMGIRTCGELAVADSESLYVRFGVWGYWLKRMGQGKDDRPVSRPDDPDTVKSVGHATTFSRDTRDGAEVRSYLLMLCEKVGFRLRKQGLMGRVVSVTLRYSDYRFRSRQSSLREHTDDDVEIYSHAGKILESLGPFPKAVRLVGVTVSDLVRDGGQGFLVDMYEKRRQMARVVDRLNARYGKLTVRHASVDISRKIGFFEPPIPPVIRPLRQRGQ